MKRDSSLRLDFARWENLTGSAFFRRYDKER